MGRENVHLAEEAEAACECHSDLAVHRAANTEAYNQIKHYCMMFASLDKLILRPSKTITKVNNDISNQGNLPRSFWPFTQIHTRVQSSTTSEVFQAHRG